MDGADGPGRAGPRVRLGNLLLGSTYRHPAVVANMAATLDHVSGGRLVLGRGPARRDFFDWFAAEIAGR